MKDREQGGFITPSEKQYERTLSYSSSERGTTARNRAFTLIELLVVIAIIGILSTVVLASLNTARDRATATAIKSEAQEFRKLLELEYLSTGSYANLNNRGWTGDPAVNTCAAAGFSGANAAKALEICNKIVNLVTFPDPRYEFFVGVDTSLGFSLNDQYSIMALLPDDTLFCIGSSGAVAQPAPFTSAGYLTKGCWRNP